ncbi:hypothetical protein [Bradyrhizobium sp. USDA 4529]
MTSSPLLKTGYVEQTGDTENAAAARAATTVTTVTSIKAEDLYTRDRGLDLPTVTGCSGDVVTEHVPKASEAARHTKSCGASAGQPGNGKRLGSLNFRAPEVYPAENNPVAIKKQRHALQAKESRDRKKAGLIRVWVTVRRGSTADYLQERGLLKEWDTENNTAIGEALSKIILVDRLFGDEGA